MIAVQEQLRNALKLIDADTALIERQSKRIKELEAQLAAPASEPNYKARYEFIRKYWLDAHFEMPGEAFRATVPEDFDAAIDAAMKDETP